MSRRSALLGVLCCACMAVDARGDEAQKVFDDLFGAKVKAAAASPDRADDLATAKELIAAAELVSQQPKMVALLCDNAYELAKKDAAGFTTALEALALLSKHVPERAADVAERTLDIRQRQFNAAKPDEKSSAGESLLDALLAHAEAKTKAKAFAEAAGSLRKAMSTARLIKSTRADSIKTALDEAVENEKLAGKLAKLQADLAAKPNDPAPPRELAMLHIIEFDDPTEASSFVLLAKDEALQKRVLLAGKPLTDVKEADALDLGEWYRGLADQTAAPLAKRKMLSRSSAYLKHYLSLKTTSDLTTTKAQLMANTVAGALDKLGGPVPVSIPDPAGRANPPAVAGSSNDTPVTDLSSLKPVASFTAPDTAAGLEPAEVGGDAKFSKGMMDGKPALVMEGVHVAFKLDDAVAKDLDWNTDRWFLRITHFDRMPGNFSVFYDAQQFTFPTNGDGRMTQVPWHQTRGTGKWVALDIELPQPRFASRQQNETDFRILIGGNMKPAYISKVELFRIKLPARQDRLLKPGQSVDLLKLTSPAIDSIQGDWERSEKDHSLRCKPSFFGRIGFPINVNGSYELKAQIARTVNIESLNFILPVGDRHVAVVLDGYAARGYYSGLEMIMGRLTPDNATAVAGQKLTNDQVYTADIRVKLGGGQAEIELDLDGQSLLRWSGPVAHLTGSNWRMPEATRLGFGGWNVGLEIKSAKLKLLDGEAVFLTAPSTMKAALLNGGAGAIERNDSDAAPLVSLQEKVEFSAGFAKPSRMGSMNFIRMAGTDLKNSIAIFPAPGKPAHLSYDLAGKYRTFIGAVGVNDVAKEPFSDLTFSIVGDGRELWKSQPTRNRAKVQPFQVNVTGVKKLELFVSCAGANGFCNSLWVEPMLYTKEVKLDALNRTSPTKGKGFFGLPTE